MPQEMNLEDFQDRAIEKIRNCIDYNALYCMEEDFNRVGLTIQQTPKRRMILCKIINGRPYAEKIIEDYIFISSLDNRDAEVSLRAIDCIINFVQAASSDPSKVEDVARTWMDGVRLYGKTIRIMEESISRAIQLSYDGVIAEGKMIIASTDRDVTSIEDACGVALVPDHNEGDMTVYEVILRDED